MPKTATAAASATLFAFDNSYARLPDRFFARLDPTPVESPRLLKLNIPLARDLGLDPDALGSQEGLSVLAGNTVAAGAQPLAQAYAGHQFGNFVPQLGDGRAHLLGEVVDIHGRRRDIQLKGSGPTPFSRMGDGRAALGPVLREYLISEAMHALGIPTTRALAAVATGDRVLRDDVLPGAILTRVASSHLRIGTFQYFAAREDHEALHTLVDYALARHDPAGLEADNRALALITGVAKRQAHLIAHWLGVGFIHGVMNTDNMTISGETIDYGPCAFMDRYDPATKFSSIDQFGRYAYGAQPQIATWNLARLAEALLSQIDENEEKAVEKAQEALQVFAPTFNEAWVMLVRRKIGLIDAQESDGALIRDLMEALLKAGADMTNSFRTLGKLVTGDVDDSRFLDEMENPTPLATWLKQWRTRLESDDGSDKERREMMDSVNPAYIPRNHLVEEVLAAAHTGDMAPFEDLLAVLQSPFKDQPGKSRYQQPARPDNQVYRTFCGT